MNENVLDLLGTLIVIHVIRHELFSRLLRSRILLEVVQAYFKGEKYECDTVQVHPPVAGHPVLASDVEIRIFYVEVSLLIRS
jgi:hypothetical protein